jgi:hypothetical protein
MTRGGFYLLGSSAVESDSLVVRVGAVPPSSPCLVLGRDAKRIIRSVDCVTRTLYLPISLLTC